MSSSSATSESHSMHSSTNNADQAHSQPLLVNETHAPVTCCPPQIEGDGQHISDKEHPQPNFSFSSTPLRTNDNNNNHNSAEGGNNYNNNGKEVVKEDNNESAALHGPLHSSAPTTSAGSSYSNRHCYSTESRRYSFLLSDREEAVVPETDTEDLSNFHNPSRNSVAENQKIHTGEIEESPSNPEKLMCSNTRKTNRTHTRRNLKHSRKGEFVMSNRVLKNIHTERNDKSMMAEVVYCATGMTTVPGQNPNPGNSNHNNITFSSNNDTSNRNTLEDTNRSEMNTNETPFPIGSSPSTLFRSSVDEQDKSCEKCARGGDIHASRDHSEKEQERTTAGSEFASSREDGDTLWDEDISPPVGEPRPISDSRDENSGFIAEDKGLENSNKKFQKEGERTVTLHINGGNKAFLTPLNDKATTSAAKLASADHADIKEEPAAHMNRLSSIATPVHRSTPLSTNMNLYLDNNDLFEGDLNILYYCCSYPLSLLGSHCCKCLQKDNSEDYPLPRAGEREVENRNGLRENSYGRGNLNVFEDEVNFSGEDDPLLSNFIHSLRLESRDPSPGMIHSGGGAGRQHAWTVRPPNHEEENGESLHGNNYANSGNEGDDQVSHISGMHSKSSKIYFFLNCISAFLVLASVFIAIYEVYILPFFASASPSGKENDLNHSDFESAIRASVPGVTVNDYTVCQAHEYKLVYSDFIFSLLSLLVNMFFILVFSYRTAKYEKPEFILGHFVVLTLQIILTAYFMMYVSPRFFQNRVSADELETNFSKEHFQTVVQNRPFWMRMVSSSPLSTGAAVIHLLLCASDVLLLLSLVLSFYLKSFVFGYRTYRQGITHPFLISLKQRYSRQQVLLQLESATAVSLALSFAFLLDSVVGQLLNGVVMVMLLWMAGGLGDWMRYNAKPFRKIVSTSASTGLVEEDEGEVREEHDDNDEEAEEEEEQEETDRGTTVRFAVDPQQNVIGGSNSDNNSNTVYRLHYAPKKLTWFPIMLLFLLYVSSSSFYGTMISKDLAYTLAISNHSSEADSSGNSGAESSAETDLSNYHSFDSYAHEYSSFFPLYEEKRRNEEMKQSLRATAVQSYCYTHTLQHCLAKKSIDIVGNEQKEDEEDSFVDSFHVTDPHSLHKIELNSKNSPVSLPRRSRRRYSSLVQLRSNETHTYLPTLSILEEYFRIKDCNETCFEAAYVDYDDTSDNSHDEKKGESTDTESNVDRGESNLYVQHIEKCCSNYGSCRVRDEFRIHAMTLSFLLLVIQTIIRCWTLYTVINRYVDNDDETIYHVRTGQR